MFPFLFQIAFMKLPQKTLERKLLASGYDQVIGIDEVGMGCLAGPVVVCAVVFDKKFFQKNNPKLRWLRESKLLLPYQREKFAAELLKEKSIKFAICYCYPKTIDRLNIYQAARKAMRGAVNSLVKSPQGSTFLRTQGRTLSSSSGHIRYPKIIVLVDGKTKIDGLKMEQRAIVKGDRKVFTIACASILAKVYRDKMMTKYSKKFPKYGFEKHKGYGTKLHRAALVKLGPCAIHRRSFAPVSKLI